MPGKTLFCLLILALSVIAWAEPNQIFKPALATEQSLPGDSLEMASWNVHRFRGPNRQGAPNQEQQIVLELQRRNFQVLLLQEVPSERVQSLADRLGLVAYVSETLPGEAKVLLVHPDLKVLQQERLWVYGDISYLARHAEVDPDEKQVWEPRAAQFLLVETPTGQRLTLWNCHLSSGPEYGEIRQQQLERCLSRLSPPALGGGDLNEARLAQILREKGFQVGGLRLDWLTSLGEGQLEVKVVANLRDQNDTEVNLSDHPLLTGRYRFPSAQENGPSKKTESD